MTEVVVAQQFNDICNRHTLFSRHEHCALLVDRRVEAYCHMTFALLDKPLQLVLYADAAHGDALGAPCVAIVGSKNLGSPEHVVKVVHRLALAHKHDVGKSVAFGQRVYLVQYVSCRKAAFKSLFAGLAEQAVHLASHLRRHAQRGAVFVGYVNRLDKLTALRREQIFYRSVNRLLAVGRRQASYAVVLFQLFAVSFRDVQHVVD